MPKKKIERLIPKCGLVSKIGLASEFETVEVDVPEEKKESKTELHTGEKSLKEEVDEMKLALSRLGEIIELLKDIRHEVRDKNGFVKPRRDYND